MLLLLYLQQRTGGRTRLVVIAGDRGLAGGYNANIFRLM
ncbi:MAG: F0F1 ATP synthase subunit gamma, partial [Lachnospiraceae bacterium]|nr:F0F1 ATP synthase subunit gamma [Lachnospiraceae bacterium]